MRRRKREILLQVISSVGLSVIFWLSIVLSQEYTHVLSLPIQYFNYPSQEILVTTLPKNIEITLSGKGFDLLKAIFNAQDSVQVDLTDALKNGFIKTKTKFDVTKFSKNLSVLSVFPDSIILKFEKVYEKRIPVRPNIEFALREGYQFVEPPMFIPDSVTIKGTENDLKNVHFWESEPITFRQIGYGNISIPLKIKQNIGVFPSVVKMRYDVRKFVQGTVVIPIQVENVPLNKSIRLYPNTLSVRFVSPIHLYHKVQVSHFQVLIDYNKIDHRFGYVVPEIKADSHFVKFFYPTPKGIRYIVRSL